MSNWQPTNRLRFVKRHPPAWYGTPDESPSMLDTSKYIRVLQQLWTDGYFSSEWRDVPLETEKAVPDAGVSPDA
ncbi:MAG: hypothetical protein IPO08_24770 [Xanthomonadales bacterium]|nr:hypothetical protein [Xanthomonadales bacterium]